MLALGEALLGLYCSDLDARTVSIERVAPLALRSLLARAAMPRVRVLSVWGGFALARLRAQPHARDARHVAASCAAKLKREQLAHGKPHGELLEAGLAIADGRFDCALSLMRHAIECFGQLDMSAYAAATRRRLGQLQGGDDGRALCAMGDAVMREIAKNVEAMTEMLCPGCRIR